jgi:predicted DNA-binding WGR domain protein
MKEYLEFVGADADRNTTDSKKFWEVEVNGKKVFVRYGRIGADGVKTVKEFPDNATAMKFAEKALAEKVKKGYSAPNAKKTKNKSVGVVGQEPISITFEYSIGFWFYMDDDITEKYKVPLTLEQKREAVANKYVFEASEKGLKPKVEISSQGRVIEIVDTAELTLRDDTIHDAVPWTILGFLETSHTISGKSAARILELFDGEDEIWKEEVLQAKIKIGKYTFLSRQVWKSE